MISWGLQWERLRILNTKQSNYLIVKDFTLRGDSVKFIGTMFRRRSLTILPTK